MNSSDTLYIGIDPASGNKDFTYCALNGDLDLIDLDNADMEEMIAFLEQRRTAVVAVNAPTGVNRGLVKKKLGAEGNNLGQFFRGVDMRLAEYELRGHGINVSGTASREEYCPAWVQSGFALYRKMSELGFELVGTEGAERQFLETQPQACYYVLVAGNLFSKQTLEGRLQRHLVLNDKGLRITDGMTFFEEITRFKLVKGILPTDALYTPEQLDVLVAAYTAWLAACQSDEVIRVGDINEGQIVLPVWKLQEKY